MVKLDLNHAKGLLCGVGATLVWGSFYPVSRLLFGNYGTEFDGITFNFYRLVAALLAMSPLLFLSPRRREFAANWRKDLLPLILLSAIGVVSEGSLVLLANKYTTAARTSLLANTSPIITVLLAWIFVHEKMTLRKAAGMLLGFAGVVLTLCSQGEDAFGIVDGGSWRGDMLALLSGVCWSVFTVAGSKICMRYGGMYAMALMLVFAVPIMGGVMLVCDAPLVVCWRWQLWAAMLYLGVVSTGFACGLWYMALKYLKPGELGAFGYFSALTAATLSVLLVKERFSLLFIFSIIAILGGIGLMVFPGSRKAEG